MLIVFRVDSASLIGNGHVMRCLSLAKFLKKTFSATCIFICNDHIGNINQKIIKAGFKLYELKIESSKKVISQSKYSSWLGRDLIDDALLTKEILKQLSLKCQWLIVDHYGISCKWHLLIRDMVNKIFVIDDLANRKYDCDLLLDQSYGVAKLAYKGLIKSKSKLLLGTNYALLKADFALLRDKSKLRRKEIINPVNLLISMGGSDPDNVSEFIIEVLSSMSIIFNVKLVLSSNAPYLQRLKDKTTNLSWLTLHVDATNMAQLIYQADLAIGAGGTSCWERACLGLPTIVISTAENQINIAMQLAKINVIKYIGMSKSLVKEQLKASIIDLQINHDDYQLMMKNCFSICDGKGIEQVVNEMIKINE